MRTFIIRSIAIFLMVPCAAAWAGARDDIANLHKNGGMVMTPDGGRSSAGQMRMGPGNRVQANKTVQLERMRAEVEKTNSNDPRLAEITFQLASSRMLHQPEKAIYEFQDAVRIMHAHGFDTKAHAREDYIRARYQEAYTYMLLNQVKSARRNYAAAVSESKKLFGPDAAVHGEALYAQAQYYVATGNDRKAARQTEEALTILAKHLPPDSLALMNLHAALVPIYERLKDDKMATKHLMVLAKDMPDTEGDPKPIYRVAPQYPQNAAMIGNDGLIKLKFRITKDGHVDDITVEKGKQGSAFAKAAIKAVSQWRYKPRIVNGEPEPSYSHFQVNFKGYKYMPTGSRIEQ